MQCGRINEHNRNSCAYGEKQTTPLEIAKIIDVGMPPKSADQSRTVHTEGRVPIGEALRTQPQYRVMDLEEAKPEEE